MGVEVGGSGRGAEGGVEGYDKAEDFLCGETGGKVISEVRLQGLIGQLEGDIWRTL